MPVSTRFKIHAAVTCAYLAAVFCGSAAAETAYSIPDADLRDSVHGVVHLHGLVFSDWDLRDAMRIASKAAGDRRVINNLTIVQGGRR